MLQQRLQMEQDAAVHKQQLQTEKQQHALQLAQEALAGAQAEAQRLQQKHSQELQLSEVHTLRFLFDRNVSGMLNSLMRAPYKFMYITERKM